MPTAPAFRPELAHITDATGHRYQVLNRARDDWDETATAELYTAGTPNFPAGD